MEMGDSHEQIGLLGFDFFATLAVSLDYLHRTVSVQSGWDFQEPSDRSAFPVDIRLGNRVPMVSAVIDGAPAQRLIVDSGGGGSMMLFDYFYRQHPEVFSDPGFQLLQFSGIGGNFETKAYHFQAVKLGHLKLENFNGYRVAGKQSYPYAADGLFGIEFLRHFNVDFDYVHAQMVLRENHDGGLLPAAR
jgi:hypothetical protein